MAANELFQFSVVSALMDGVAEKGVPISDLLAQGNHGLGTFRHMVGEMIVVDGTVYQMKSDGSVATIDKAAFGDTIAPYAMITRFEPTATTSVSLENKQKFTGVLSELLPNTKNHYLAYRLEGAFKSITIRTVGGQQHPHESLAEVGKHQTSHSLENVRGTIIGFRSPEFLQGVSVAGDHLHFISEDRKHGGHMLACESDGEVEIQAAPIWNVHLRLPKDDDDFSQATLKSDSEGIAAVEG